MRTSNSIKNVIVSIVMNLSIIIIGLITQKIFLNTLGTEYLGINGLFSNIISMLGIVELGLGSAIIYNLYEPVSKNDTKKIKSLMKFYKTGYRIIMFVIAILGLCIIPIIPLIVNISIPENINYIYILFLADTVFSYTLTYKRSILYAHQKNYIINLVHTAYLFIVNILQVGVLLSTKNYYLYLIIKIIMRLIENIVLVIIANRKYPIIKEKDAKELDDVTKKDIFTKIKGLLYHKIGSFVVLGTDNIIISSFINIKTVGLYSNYSLIINALNNLVSQMFSVITASVGNLLVERDKKKSYVVYKRLRFINFWISSFVAISFLVIVDSFIGVWIGKKYLLELGVTITLAINLYLQLFRGTINSFKEAAGIFHEDRFIPIVESIVNIVASLIFLQIFGLKGIFMGTVCSNLVLHLYSYPKFVYKKLFKKNYSKYYQEFITYFIIAILSGTFTLFISRSIIVNNVFMSLVINILLCLFIPNLIYIILFSKKPEYKYCHNLLSNLIKKKKL